jgi:hypothetical protein
MLSLSQDYTDTWERLERVRKDGVVAWFQLLSLHLLGPTMKSTKILFSVEGAPAEFRNSYLPKISQKRYSWDQLAR